MKTTIKLCFAILIAVIGGTDLHAQNSGNVVLRFDGNDVKLTGDAQDNAVRVSVMPAGNKAIVQVEGLWGTKVNGKLMVSRAITNLDDMRMDFLEGSNRIYVDDYVALTTHADIMINGSGVDFVSIEDGWARSIVITGANFVNCESYELSEDCSIFATDANDTILIDSRETEGLHIETFDGHDTIEVTGDIWGEVNIVSGINSKFNAYIDSDDVTLTDFHCVDLTISTGSGNDRIKCVEDDFWFAVWGTAVFDGGNGWDFLFLNELFQRDHRQRSFFDVPDFNDDYRHENVEFVYGELDDIYGHGVTGGW